MEKHSFDRRLAERLRQHEKTPRPEAWKRLEERLGREEERRRVIPFWYYGLAASVAMLLLAGIWWRGQSDLEVQPEVAVKTQPKVTRPQPAEAPEQTKLNSLQSVLPETASATTQLVAQPAKAPALRAQQNEAAAQSINVEVPDESTGINPPVGVAVAEPNTPSTTQTLAATTPQGPAVESSHSAKTLVVKLTGPEPDIQNEAQSRKRSRFIRVFNQLKNAKNGEQVDWKEVGFNPNTVLARAEEKLERNTEKINQSYQNLKEKTNF